VRAQNKKIFKRVLLATAMVVVYLLFIVCRDKSVDHYKRGTVLEKKGEHDQAILCFDKAIKIKPRFAEAYCNRGIAYAQKGEYDRAISDYNKAIEINPMYAMSYNNRGLAYYFKQEYDKAWEDVHKAQSLGYQVRPEVLKNLREASGRESP